MGLSDQNPKSDGETDHFTFALNKRYRAVKSFNPIKNVKPMCNHSKELQLMFWPPFQHSSDLGAKNIDSEKHEFSPFCI